LNKGVNRTRARQRIYVYLGLSGTFLDDGGDPVFDLQAAVDDWLGQS